MGVEAPEPARPAAPGADGGRATEWAEQFLELAEGGPEQPEFVVCDHSDPRGHSRFCLRLDNYEQFLELAPDDPRADDIRAKVESLRTKYGNTL